MNRPPWWKRLLSYLYDLRIASSDSAYSGRLDLMYSRGRYALATPRALYSYEDLYTTFRKTFEALPLERLPLRRVLVLGMGLGSIPLLLERTFGKVCEYTLVEIDPAVIDLAQRYGCFQAGLQSPMRVVQADAALWVGDMQQEPESYDLICVDIFIDDAVPTPIESLDFLQALKKRLHSQGLLLYNRLNYTEKIMHKTIAFYEKNFKFVFEQATYIDMEGNRMLLNRPV